MTNGEKYYQQILDIICDNDTVAVSKITGELVACNKITCKDCIPREINPRQCGEALKQWLNQEYVGHVDWSKVEIDTKVLVRDFKDCRWIKRYFAGVRNGIPCVWQQGATSWSADGLKTNWRYIKLAED